MQKSFKLIVTFLICHAFGLAVIAQTQVKFKDVLLDGKPAKLNIATGEIVLVKIEDNVVESNIDSVLTKSIMPSNSDGIINSKGVGEVDDASDIYVVKDNETLLDVARRYNVSLTQLKQANNLETTLINKGQRLRVRNFDVKSETMTSTDDLSENANANYHIVQKGNTLFSISRQYNLSVQDLKRINSLETNLINVGQKLRVKKNETSTEDTKQSVYIVKTGDNLYRIALKNGTSVNEIKRLNGLSSNLITVGQKLLLR
ncbi:peptidoglycan endopeptidase LytF [Winogradskyella eximia]|uniref:Peptidoglycan endopeptidase LytF n=1 Tax=Winogradskyella eximia TaxID=262006 RepID=A0A3D9GQ52_9FLAO|nr:LysM peptidoglycan-binding domain-containing protein [Winogradskyella eximia]RED38600.1 peptidoglycan endopeptidase LytF [Winogradskyella eximia]